MEYKKYQRRYGNFSQITTQNGVDEVAEFSKYNGQLYYGLYAVRNDLQYYYDFKIEDVFENMDNLIKLVKECSPDYCFPERYDEIAEEEADRLRHVAYKIEYLAPLVTVKKLDEEYYNIIFDSTASQITLLFCVMLILNDKFRKSENAKSIIIDILKDDILKSKNGSFEYYGKDFAGLIAHIFSNSKFTEKRDEYVKFVLSHYDAFQWMKLLFNDEELTISDIDFCIDFAHKKPGAYRMGKFISFRKMGLLGNSESAYVELKHLLALEEVLEKTSISKLVNKFYEAGKIDLIDKCFDIMRRDSALAAELKLSLSSLIDYLAGDEVSFEDAESFGLLFTNKRGRWATWFNRSDYFGNFSNLNDDELAIIIPKLFKSKGLHIKRWRESGIYKYNEVELKNEHESQRCDLQIDDVMESIDSDDFIEYLNCFYRIIKPFEDISDKRNVVNLILDMDCLEKRNIMYRFVEKYPDLLFIAAVSPRISSIKNIANLELLFVLCEKNTIEFDLIPLFNMICEFDGEVSFDILELLNLNWFSIFDGSMDEYFTILLKYSKNIALFKIILEKTSCLNVEYQLLMLEILADVNDKVNLAQIGEYFSYLCIDECGNFLEDIKNFKPKGAFNYTDLERLFIQRHHKLLGCLKRNPEYYELRTKVLDDWHNAIAIRQYNEIRSCISATNSYNKEAADLEFRRSCGVPITMYDFGSLPRYKLEEEDKYLASLVEFQKKLLDSMLMSRFFEQQLKFRTDINERKFEIERYRESL